MSRSTKTLIDEVFAEALVTLDDEPETKPH